MLLDKTLMNNALYYQFLRRLANTSIDNSDESRECKIDIINIESNDIKAITMKTVSDNNFMLILVDNI